MNPMQFAIYKGMGGKNGAVQFGLGSPHYYEEANKKNKDYTGEKALENGRPKDGWKAREGAIFVSITSTKPGQKNVYDWDNKIVFSLSVTDMSKVLQTLISGEECKIMHDPGAQTSAAKQVQKYFNITSPNGIKQGVMISVTQTSGNDKRTHTVPVSGDEALALRVLVTKAISNALNW
jgi:hypothetical protein